MMNKRILAIASICCIMVAFCTPFVLAQSTTMVSGHVYNETNNEPVSGAHIHIENTDTSQDYNFDTGGNGYYSFNLPLGDYHVTVEADDYQPWEQSFSVGDPTPQTHDIFLQPMNEPGDNNIDDSSDDDSNVDGDESGGFEMPFGDIDEDFMETMLTILVSLVVIFFVCLITITVALIVISVRLGKIRKELIALNENQKPKVQPVQQMYQQPPPPPQ